MAFEKQPTYKSRTLFQNCYGVAIRRVLQVSGRFRKGTHWVLEKNEPSVGSLFFGRVLPMSRVY